MTVADVRKVIQVNLCTLYRYWEPAQRGDGASREHATYSILHESYTSNTGSFPRDAKGDGK